MTRHGLKDDGKQILRGLLMGGADIVPGVSGGTVALILGIYERLITAISHVDLKLLELLRERRWSAAAAHLDSRFLAALGLGVALGVGGLARLMHYLLHHHPEPTWSLFFGLILASSLLVARMVKPWSAATVVCALGGIGFAFWLMGLLPASPPDGWWYLFLCGLLGSCAMILPGISGAFIVLILGKYLYITGAIKDLVHFQITTETIMATGVFGAGWAVGIVSFSKFLRWLLNRWEAVTLAMLGGFMLGSLRKIWPFKRQVSPDELSASLEELQLTPEKLESFTVNVWPDHLGGHFWLCVALAVVGFVFVLVTDWLTQGHEHVPPLEAADHEPRDEN